MQKMLLISDADFDELEMYLSDGWRVVNMSACGNEDWCGCYVLIEKIDELPELPIDYDNPF